MCRRPFLLVGWPTPVPPTGEKFPLSKKVGITLQRNFYFSLPESNETFRLIPVLHTSLLPDFKKFIATLPMRELFDPMYYCCQVVWQIRTLGIKIFLFHISTQSQYGISLCLCEIRIYLFGMFTFAILPDNSICLFNLSNKW